MDNFVQGLLAFFNFLSLCIKGLVEWRKVLREQRRAEMTYTPLHPVYWSGLERRATELG